MGSARVCPWTIAIFNPDLRHRQRHCRHDQDKIKEWEKDIDALAEIAISEPQLAYAAYIYGTSRRWQFVCRTTPGISEVMVNLETLIRKKLLPAILGCDHISDQLRVILQLPARMGGMGFLNPSLEADSELSNSKDITAQLVEFIYQQKDQMEIDASRQEDVMKEMRRMKEERQKNLEVMVHSVIDEKMKRLLQLSAEKGASAWLTSLPLKSHGFHLNKQQFHDAVCMRFDLKNKNKNKNNIPFPTHKIKYIIRRYKRTNSSNGIAFQFKIFRELY